MGVIIVFPFATVATMTLASTTGVLSFRVLRWLSMSACAIFFITLYFHSAIAIAIAFKATVEVTVPNWSNFACTKRNNPIAYKDPISPRALIY